MSSKTKKLLITVGIIVVVAIILYSFFGGSYNKMVNKQETVNTAWSNVETQYQRRADLIPNLVATVKGYAAHEKSTLTQVIQARASATKVTIDASHLNAASMKQFQAAQGGLTQALSHLMMVSERYPNLKADKNFMALQAQIEGTENRITYARMQFNKTAKDYNIYIRKFPQSMLAGMYGFSQKPYFQASAGSQNAPKVQF